MRAFANIKNPGSGATRAGGNVTSSVWWTNAHSNQVCATSQ